MSRNPAPAKNLIGQIILVYAGVWVLLHTVVTAPGLTRALQFDPHAPADRVWAILTYPFVHLSLVHLALSAALLAWAGPPVVRAMGRGRFLVYYGYCTLGGGALALLLSGLTTVPPLAGALAPGLGVAMARGWCAEDDTVNLAPFPGRLRVRAVVGLVAMSLALAGIFIDSSALSLAHVGGFLAGFGYFHLQALARRPAPPAARPVRRPVMSPVRHEAQEPSSEPVPPVVPAAAPAPPPPAAADPAGLDRLLDKISAHGMGSLTPQEHRMLAEYAERKRQNREKR